MADVKWIKITTDVFDDEKILMIESMPSADSIIVIWFKLLAFAGRQNNDGVFLMSNRIAYTDEMLASIFRRDVNVVRLALNAFEQFGMIEIIDGVITIPNWNKHQTLDAYEKKKERDRIYQQQRRAAQRALIESSSENSSDKSFDNKEMQSSDVAVSEGDKEKEEEKEEERKIIDYQQIVDRFNALCPSFPSVKSLSDARKKAIKARFNTYSIDDFEELFKKAESSDFLKGGNDRNWTANFDWLIKDANMAKVLDGNYDNKNGTYTRQEVVPSWMKNKKPGFNDFMKQEYDMDELESELLSNGPGFEERKEALQNRLKEKYGKGK